MKALWILNYVGLKCWDFTPYSNNTNPGDDFRNFVFYISFHDQRNNCVRKSPNMKIVCPKMFLIQTSDLSFIISSMRTGPPPYLPPVRCLCVQLSPVLLTVTKQLCALRCCPFRVQRTPTRRVTFWNLLVAELLCQTLDRLFNGQQNTAQHQVNSFVCWFMWVRR